MSIAVVTGAAGFIGSHVSARLIREGHVVVGVDDLSSSRRESDHLTRLLREKAFHFIEFDIASEKFVREFFTHLRKYKLNAGDVVVILNFACPASPPSYQLMPKHTFLSSIIGVENLLLIADEIGCRFVHSSTSEVYGDPEVHPQTESYRGCVNTWGPRACYDEGKRAAETLCYMARESEKTDTRVIRIFNTYGPHMRPDDGRVVTSFLKSAIMGQPITVYGDGTQTRSLCYVDDLVEGFMRVSARETWDIGPMNLGNPNEFTVLEIARLAKELVTAEFGQCDSEITHECLPMDDPRVRKPDISLASREISWTPKISFRDGMTRLLRYWGYQQIVTGDGSKRYL